MHADKGGGGCVLRQGSGRQSCLHRGWHFLLPLSAAVPAVATGRARARACARGPALSGFAARSSPLRLTAALRPAQPPNPSSSDAARHARPNRARLLQPRHAQLRVERALALAHAARPSQGLRPAARLSARRQRTVLHSPLNPSASAAARHARPKHARLPRPRQPQLRVERALVLAHAARPSQGLRSAARLSAKRQQRALHSPPLTVLLPPRHGTRG